MTSPAPAASKRLLLCSCQKTMPVDAAAISAALGLPDIPVLHSELCRNQSSAFEAALASGTPLHVACTQEAPFFRELAEAAGKPDADLCFTNIRERAGWCAKGRDPTAKMAALLAEAGYAPTPARLLTLKSEGTCLVYGTGQAALDAAAALSDRLSVSVLLSDPADATPPAVATVPVARGVIRTATGRLGAFEIEVDGYAGVLPSSRARLEFTLPRNGARSNCDLIVDLSGRPALFGRAARREGYLRADPQDAAAVARALLAASDLVGEFEKPLYVDYDASICAHARSAKVGCRKCLDVCPTGAITPDGDRVRIDPAICGGCATCSAVCPTGAAAYTYPTRTDLLARVDLLLSTYRRAGGIDPVLLLHDERHGEPLIAALARYGAGLPVHVLPVSHQSVTGFGHDTLVACLVLGAAHVVLLGAPEHPEELAALEGELTLARAFLDGLGYPGERLHLTASRDPETLGALCESLGRLQILSGGSLPVYGTKRDIARTALSRLHAAAPTPVDRLPLPKGAPYGRIAIDPARCTLCLACVGACPTNALADDPDRPQVSFTEAACVQCGICVSTCPETAITLAPGYDFTSAALSPTVLHGEEPFHCIECGKAFGTHATVSRVLERLKGHAMFRNEQQTRLIQMCDTCRIVTVSNAGNDPMRLGERPRIVTTDDYLAARDKKGPKTPDDFMN